MHMDGKWPNAVTRATAREHNLLPEVLSLDGSFRRVLILFDEVNRSAFQRFSTSAQSELQFHKLLDGMRGKKVIYFHIFSYMFLSGEDVLSGLVCFYAFRCMSLFVRFFAFGLLDKMR